MAVRPRESRIMDGSGAKSVSVHGWQWDQDGPCSWMTVGPRRSRFMDGSGAKRIPVYRRQRQRVSRFMDGRGQEGPGL